MDMTRQTHAVFQLQDRDLALDGRDVVDIWGVTGPIRL